MPGIRSRLGCEECRRRRRKCDEQKPACGQCSAFNRSCSYTLKVVWSSRNAVQAHVQSDNSRSAIMPRADRSGNVTQLPEQGTIDKRPPSLVNGVPLPPRYQKLFVYFKDNVLASLSCHPIIHQDFCNGLVPATLQSPHLLSACLALSAAGLSSRGITNIDGIEVDRILGHLQSSGLSLLRKALANGQMNETLLATCLIWCLADVFACGLENSGWRIHLQGIRAILDDRRDYSHPLSGSSGDVQLPMRHLHLLYLLLQTLPFVPSLSASDDPVSNQSSIPGQWSSTESRDPKIDGFLGYSQELLCLIQQINSIPASDYGAMAEADILLGKIYGMMNREIKSPLGVSIRAPLSPEEGREYSLCHNAFQQAALIVLYRRLYRMSSASEPIQSAVAMMQEMIDNMTQGEPCHAWVAMAMPLFTIGCEAFTTTQKDFVLDKIKKFDACLGSLHVRTMRKALEDIWQLRDELCDAKGAMCSGELLRQLQYSVVLF